MKKSIYGLKQASTQWFEKLVKSLTDMNFEQSKNDYIFFIKGNNGLICIAAVYVDDIILTRTDMQAMDELKINLHQLFGIKDLGNLSYFLGIEVGYAADGIILSQKKFTRELIHVAFNFNHNQVLTLFVMLIYWCDVICCDRSS